MDQVSKIEELMPNCSVDVEMIIGFLGETNAHFMDTYKFLSDLEIYYLQVFTYSQSDDADTAVIYGVILSNVRKSVPKCCVDYPLRNEGDSMKVS